MARLRIERGQTGGVAAGMEMHEVEDREGLEACWSWGGVAIALSRT